MDRGTKAEGTGYIQRGKPGAGERDARDGPRSDPAGLTYIGDQAIAPVRSDGAVSPPLP